MNWLKRLFSIKTDFEVMLDYLRASHESDRELIRAQMATIDRVIAARYDRPTLAPQDAPIQTPSVNVDDYVDVNVDDDTFLERLGNL